MPLTSPMFLPGHLFVGPTPLFSYSNPPNRRAVRNSRCPTGSPAGSRRSGTPGIVGGFPQSHGIYLRTTAVSLLMQPPATRHPRVRHPSRVGQ